MAEMLRNNEPALQNVFLKLKKTFRISLNNSRGD